MREKGGIGQRRGEEKKERRERRDKQKGGKEVHAAQHPSPLSFFPTLTLPTLTPPLQQNTVYVQSL